MSFSFVSGFLSFLWTFLSCASYFHRPSVSFWKHHIPTTCVYLQGDLYFTYHRYTCRVIPGLHIVSLFSILFIFVVFVSNSVSSVNINLMLISFLVVAEALPSTTCICAHLIYIPYLIVFSLQCCVLFFLFSVYPQSYATVYTMLYWCTGNCGRWITLSRRGFSGDLTKSYSCCRKEFDVIYFSVTAERGILRYY